MDFMNDDEMLQTVERYMRDPKSDDATTLAIEFALRTLPRPLDDWHEDIGNVLWWQLPVREPPWVGTPLDSDWPTIDDTDAPYYTHWTPLICPFDTPKQTLSDEAETDA